MRNWPVLLLVALLGMAAFADQPAALVVGVLAALVAAGLVACGRLADTRPAHVHATSLRQRARRAGVPPLCDPDAPGRARPRAPSTNPA